MRPMILTAAAVLAAAIGFAAPASAAVYSPARTSVETASVEGGSGALQKVDYRKGKRGYKKHRSYNNRKSSWRHDNRRHGHRKYSKRHNDRRYAYGHRDRNHYGKKYYGGGKYYKNRNYGYRHRGYGNKYVYKYGYDPSPYYLLPGLIYGTLSALTYPYNYYANPYPYQPYAPAPAPVPYYQGGAYQAAPAVPQTEYVVTEPAIGYQPIYVAPIDDPALTYSEQGR